jgi:hypothetical protein
VKSRGPSVEKVGKCDVVSRHLQDCSPRLCLLRNDRLTPVSKYWIYRWHAGVMGSVNWCSLLLTCAWLLLLLRWLSWEKNWVVDMWISQPACWGLYQEPFFSKAIWFIQCCWWLAKGCHVRRLPTENVCVAYMDWRQKCTCHVSGFPLQGVHQFKSPWLSDMSTAYLWPSARN